MKEILDKQKYIDEEMCTININKEFIEDNPLFNKFSFLVGPLLQVVNIYQFKIIFFNVK